MIVVLVGFMGAGKTTVGHILAEHLGLPFVDSDVLIEQRLGRSVRDIFASEGEARFREIEHQTITGLVRAGEAVLALGGGALVDGRTRVVLRNAHIAYLRVGYPEAMARVRGDEYRPMLDRADLQEIYQTRLPIYEELSAFTVDTGGRRPDAVAMDVLAQLNRLPELPAGSSSVFVTPVGGAYHAYVGPGLLAHVARLMPQTPEADQGVLISTEQDRAVADRVATQLAELGLRVVPVWVPEGAEAKTLPVYGDVVLQLEDHAVHKGDVIVAVGGEEVCELAGFVASTFNRGMRLVLVPTTLGSQADSSVGGKNGLDLRRGHNLVGTVHQPAVVVSDIGIAQRSAPRGFAPGLAEIAKHALISASDLLPFVLDNSAALLRGDHDVLRAVVSRSIEVKADIVSRDERDEGDRLFLNYGHTFAYAMEAAGRKGGRTGDSLSLGLMAAALLAFHQGLADAGLVDAHRRLLDALGLPTAGEFTVETLREAWLRDKKYRRGARFVVLRGLGRPEAGIAADDRDLEQVLADLARG